jgi:uncharacterized protein (TIGR02246 family)
VKRGLFVPVIVFLSIGFSSVVAYSQPLNSGTVPIAHRGCTPQDEAAIRLIPQQWMDAYNGKNAAKLAALYSEDAYYLTQHFASGVVHLRTNIEAYVRRGVAVGYHVDSIQMIALDCSDDFAYAITRYQANNNGEKAIGVNLVVLRKSGSGKGNESKGKWLIVAHEAAVPDPATAIQTLGPVNPR